MLTFPFSCLQQGRSWDWLGIRNPVMVLAFHPAWGSRSGSSPATVASGYPLGLCADGISPKKPSRMTMGRQLPI
jgi:hypothetical protein